MTKRDEAWLDAELRRTRIPAPPPQLRARALNAAAAAAPEHLKPWERLWLSRTARIAWAATVVGLLLLNGVSRRDAASTPAATAAAPDSPRRGLPGSIEPLAPRYAAATTRTSRSSALAELVRAIRGERPPARPATKRTPS